MNSSAWNQRHSRGAGGGDGPSPYLGPGEDGAEEVDEPELEGAGQLPPALETLCGDEEEEADIYFGPKNEEKFLFLPKSTCKIQPAGRGTQLTLEGLRTREILRQGGDFWYQKGGFVLKTGLSLGIYGPLRGLGDFFAWEGGFWGLSGSTLASGCRQPTDSTVTLSTPHRSHTDLLFTPQIPP